VDSYGAREVHTLTTHTPPRITRHINLITLLALQVSRSPVQRRARAQRHEGTYDCEEKHTRRATTRTERRGAGELR
jgi:hypothetical protein